QRCNCTVEKTLGNWNYTDERCNYTTYLANRSRIVRIRKTGGLKGCTFPKKENETIIDNNKGIFMDNKFQFHVDNDNNNATFDIIETGDIILPYDSRCPINCAGSWGAWGACNAVCINNNSSANGSRTRTYSITTPSDNGGKACPNPTTETETCTKDCSVNCIGLWENWSNCNAVCINNNSSASGNRTRTFTITTPSANGGIACPTTETKTCTKDCSVKVEQELL
ncbi:hypothetical protein EB077_13825, partial [bacterium]|nr:hypothetical protein [bacterium]